MEGTWKHTWNGAVYFDDCRGQSADEPQLSHAVDELLARELALRGGLELPGENQHDATLGVELQVFEKLHHSLRRDLLRFVRICNAGVNFQSCFNVHEFQSRTSVAIEELLDALAVDQTAHFATQVAIGKLEEVVDRQIELPLVRTETRQRHLLARLREGHKLTHLVALRTLQLVLKIRKKGGIIYDCLD